MRNKFVSSSNSKTTVYFTSTSRNSTINSHFNSIFNGKWINCNFIGANVIITVFVSIFITFFLFSIILFLISLLFRLLCESQARPNCKISAVNWVTQRLPSDNPKISWAFQQQRLPAALRFYPLPADTATSNKFAYTISTAHWELLAGEWTFCGAPKAPGVAHWLYLDVFSLPF